MPCSPGMVACRATCRHREKVRDYHAARAAQLEAAEAATLGYATEWAAYTAEHPLITFREWLIGTAAPAELARLEYADDEHLAELEAVA